MILKKFPDKKSLASAAADRAANIIRNSIAVRGKARRTTREEQAPAAAVRHERDEHRRALEFRRVDFDGGTRGEDRA